LSHPGFGDFRLRNLQYQIPKLLTRWRISKAALGHPAFGSHTAEPINRSIEEGMSSTGEPNALLITLAASFPGEDSAKRKKRMVA
jgi:hypothetical protein